MCPPITSSREGTFVRDFFRRRWRTAPRSVPGGPEHLRGDKGGQRLQGERYRDEPGPDLWVVWRRETERARRGGSIPPPGARLRWEGYGKSSTGERDYRGEDLVHGQRKDQAVRGLLANSGGTVAFATANGTLEQDPIPNPGGAAWRDPLAGIAAGYEKPDNSWLPRGIGVEPWAHLRSLTYRQPDCSCRC